MDRRSLTPSEMPATLSDMRRPPREVNLWGEMPPGPYVAIVGSRAPTPAGRRSAYRLARELAERGVTIVSGGALGIDTAAHEGALDAGGRTLVCAPLWFERAYPKENAPLFERVVANGGGYLTLSTRDAEPFNPVFFERNEALVALSAILVVGECRHRSGAKNAVLHARRLGRPLFVLPSLYGNSSGAGSNALLGDGARPVQTPREFVRLLGSFGSYDNPPFWHAVAELAQPRETEKADTKGAQSRRTRGRARSTERSSSRVMSPTATTTVLAGGPAEKDESPRGRVVRALLAGAQTLEAVRELAELEARVVQHELVLLTLGGQASEDERGLLRYHPAPS